MIVLPQPQVVVEGLTLPECPRWHDGALHFSDIAAGRIFRLDADDQAVLVYDSPDDFIGGLGFSKGGELLAIGSKRREVLRIDAGQAAAVADLSTLCPFVLNDMVVSGDHMYVSQPGFDIWSAPAQGMPDPTDIILASPTGDARIAASGMMSPNGMAISPDGRTLYVAECTAMRITCFTIDTSTGDLSNRRVFAVLPDGGIPDGICLDSQGSVWAAVPVASRDGVFGAGPGVVRLAANGEATHVVPVGEGRRALACAFGGADRASLYICTVPDFEGAGALSDARGHLERIAIRFVGAGTP